MVPFSSRKVTISKESIAASPVSAILCNCLFLSLQEKQAKYLLRSSLKIIQEELKRLPLIRCHRSYMVNFEKVKIIRREKDGLRLELETPTPTEIPVSKTYVEEVFKAFGENME